MQLASDRRTVTEERFPINGRAVELQQVVKQGEAACSFQAYGLNLSSGGLSLRAKRGPSVGSKIRCTFSNDSGSFQAEGRVVWSTSGQDDCEFGLRFDGKVGEGALQFALRRPSDAVPGSDAHANPKQIVHAKDLEHAAVRLRRVLQHKKKQSDSEQATSSIQYDLNEPIVLRFGDSGAAVKTVAAHRAEDIIVVEQPLGDFQIGHKVSIVSDSLGHRDGTVETVDLIAKNGTPKLILGIAFTQSKQLNHRRPRFETADASDHLRELEMRDDDGQGDETFWTDAHQSTGSFEHKPWDEGPVTLQDVLVPSSESFTTDSSSALGAAAEDTGYATAPRAYEDPAPVNAHPAYTSYPPVVPANPREFQMQRPQVPESTHWAEYAHAQHAVSPMEPALYGQDDDEVEGSTAVFVRSPGASDASPRETAVREQVARVVATQQENYRAAVQTLRRVGDSAHTVLAHRVRQARSWSQRTAAPTLRSVWTRVRYIARTMFALVRNLLKSDVHKKRRTTSIVANNQQSRRAHRPTRQTSVSVWDNPATLRWLLTLMIASLMGLVVYQMFFKDDASVVNEKNETPATQSAQVEPTAAESPAQGQELKQARQTTDDSQEEPYPSTPSGTSASVGRSTIADGLPIAARFGASYIEDDKTRHELRMSGDVTELRGIEDNAGFTVVIPGRLSLDPAAPIAESQSLVERAIILNRGDHAVLSVRFVPGRKPKFRVVARGSVIEVEISNRG